MLCWWNTNSSRITVNAQPGTVFQERFAKKNEAEDLRRAFDKLDTKGYTLFNVMKTACMTSSFPQWWQNRCPRASWGFALAQTRNQKSEMAICNSYSPWFIPVYVLLKISLALRQFFCSVWSRGYHLGSRWWLWQVCQLVWVSGHVSSMPGWPNWYCVVRGDIGARSPLSSSFSRRISGYEPRRLFNIVEFIMNDRDGSGSVSVEEATQILYLRFGNGLLDKVSFRKI